MKENDDSLCDKTLSCSICSTVDEDDVTDILRCKAGSDVGGQTSTGYDDGDTTVRKNDSKRFASSFIC